MNTKEEIEILVEENMKLVHFIISRKYKNYMPRITKLGLYEDFYQEGCVGLFKAAKAFDKNKGFKFSTFGVKWIDFSLRKFVNRYIPKHYKDNVISADKNMGGDGDVETTILNTVPIYDNYKTDLYDLKEFAKTTEIEYIENILDLYLLGLSQREIGEKLGLSQVMVSRRMIALRENYEMYEALGELVRMNKVS